MAQTLGFLLFFLVGLVCQVGHGKFDLLGFFIGTFLVRFIFLDLFSVFCFHEMWRISFSLWFYHTFTTSSNQIFIPE